MATSTELKLELSDLKKDKTSLENRISDLQKVRSNIVNLADEASDVNLYYGNAKYYLENGLNGINTSLASGYDVFKQSDPTVDGNMSGAIADIDSEISRCQTKLETCINKISKTKTDISDAEAAEKAAEQQNN